MGRKKTSYKIKNFVALRGELLLNKAYIELEPTARSMLPYFLWKVKIPYSHPDYCFADFTFTFSEAGKYGCSKSTFYRVLEELTQHGFIDPVRKGGRNGGRDTASIFRLSKRWEKYEDKVDFVPRSWKRFGEEQIRSQVQKWHSPVVKSEPQRDKEAQGQCQK